jgi:hypothetical protein
MTDVQGHPHHCQQELRLVVAARLAAMQNGKPRFRGKACRHRRPFDARGIAAAVAVLPGAVPEPRRPQGVGHAGDRRISARDQARGRPVAGRSGAARALPLDLRRDAFRLFQSALGAADESQGAFPRLQILGRRARRHRAHHRDLARVHREVRRTLFVRRKPCAADAMYAPVCTRFPPTTSRSIRFRRNIAAPSWRCR